jgi:hypothetical protein
VTAVFLETAISAPGICHGGTKLFRPVSPGDLIIDPLGRDFGVVEMKVPTEGHSGMSRARLSLLVEPLPEKEGVTALVHGDLGKPSSALSVVFTAYAMN